MVLPPDEPNEEEKLEQLPEDYDTPAAMPGEPDVDIADAAADEHVPQRPTLEPTHPITDADFEETGAYHGGMLDGANVDGEPNANDAVINYDPTKDKRKAA